MSIQKIHILHHSHYDIGYTHPQPILRHLTSRFIDDVIEICEKTADYPQEARAHWMCEVTMPVLEWLEQASSHSIGRFRKLVNENRISIGALNYHGNGTSSMNDLAEVLQPIKKIA